MSGEPDSAAELAWQGRLADEAATIALGEDFAAVIQRGDVICLTGDLGAGKTCFARGLLRALSDDPALEVPSPTFTLVQAYETPRLTVSHFDLYRLEAAEDLDALGFEEAATNGAVLVEWPERAAERMPEDAVIVELTIADSGREVRVEAAGEVTARLRRSFAARRFLDDSGFAGAARHHLQGDASTRAYERISNNGQRAVLMNAPARPDGPPLPGHGRPYSKIAHLAEDVGAFAAIDVILRGAGFSAPELFGRDLAAGFLLLEDFGGAGFVADGAPIAERYLAAVDCLAALHRVSWPREVALGRGRMHRIPDYDPIAMAVEVELLIDWYLPHITGERLATAAEEEFRALWQALFVALQSAEQSLVLRDYHSPNLIWLAERTGIARVGLIDFQDAMIGPAAYDVASLVQDARVTVSDELEARLMARYEAARAGDAGFDAAGFRAATAMMAAQRATKVLGIFARLNARDGKPGYLAHLPRVEAYLMKSLGHPVLSALKVWYERHLPHLFR